MIKNVIAEKRVNEHLIYYKTKKNRFYKIYMDIFGNRKVKRISKIHYENVIHHLKGEKK